MSKLIFLDVDGTLVDYHNRIPESSSQGNSSGTLKWASGLCLYRP